MDENMGNIDFLQSEEWRKFQEAFGRQTFRIDGANVIEHNLPIVGKYFYVPRGYVSQGIIDLAKNKKVGWIRFDPESLKNVKAVKAPHDMQPKEVFVIDIAKPEEELLNGMKQKTRYNLKLAEKKGVKIFIANEKKHIDEFLRLVAATARRKGIKFHPEDYYRKMIEAISENILKLYCAEYNGKIIAANLIVFYRKTAVYLHGATDDEYRNVMAPYLLQWKAIKDAKNAGCERYDFGGVNTEIRDDESQIKNSWSGITKFKLGFSQNTKSTKFPGSYDIAINPIKYWLYKTLQKIKSLGK